MSDLMTFPNTVEEFMEEYKIIDTEQVYTNGAELVPIFRMKQWFEHLSATEPEPSEVARDIATIIENEQDMRVILSQQSKTGKWLHPYQSHIASECSVCHMQMPVSNYFHFCPHCGAKMEEEET